jgi:hypothetical protein
MSEGPIRQCNRMFKDRWTNVHDEERSGWLSVVSDDLVQSVDQKICERRRFTISALSYEFLQISYTAIYEIITVRRSFCKFCTRWVSENAHKFTQNGESGLGFDFFRAIPQRWRWISQSYCMSNRWNLGFICECWNQRAVKAANAPVHQPSWKKFKQMLSGRKPMASVFWDRKGELMAQFIQQGTTITSEV